MLCHAVRCRRDVMLDAQGRSEGCGYAGNGKRLNAGTRNQEVEMGRIMLPRLQIQSGECSDIREYQ